MAEKPDSKRKQLIYADLNFISNHTLEDIAENLQRQAKAPITASVIEQDNDTALFHLKVTRQDRVTAQVNGRLKRWAGQMTHVYADGEAYVKRDWAKTGRRLLQRPTLSISAWLVLTAFFIGLLMNNVLPTISVLMLMLLFVGLFFYSVWLVIQHYLIPLRVQFKDGHISKPEAKDRDRLLDLLVEVIRDEHIPQQPAETSLSSNPLSDDELAALLVASSGTQQNTL